jgi:hypothetical protein
VTRATKRNLLVVSISGQFRIEPPQRRYRPVKAK